MKTVGSGITAAQNTLRLAGGYNVIYLAEIDLGATTYRYSTRAVTVAGNAYDPRLLNISGMTKRLQDDTPRIGRLPVDQCRIALASTPEDANAPSNLIAANRLEGSVVRLYAVFSDGTALVADDRIILHTYLIEDIASLTDEAVVLTLSDFVLGYLEKMKTVAITESDFPQSDPASIGSPLPIIFGSVSDCPLIPVAVGGRTTLDGILDADDTFIDVTELSSDPLSPYYFAASPQTPLTIRIDAEEITVKGLSYALKRFGSASDASLLERGANATTPAQHGDGSTVLEVRAAGYDFAVARHRCKSVSNIRAGGGAVQSGTSTKTKQLANGEIVQLVTLADLPSWTDSAGSTQLTDLKTLAASGSAADPDNCTNDDVFEPTNLRANQNVILSPDYALTADQMGELINGHLVIEYAGNPYRKVATDARIWNAGDFDVKIRRGTDEVSANLDAPLGAECTAVQSDSHTHDEQHSPAVGTLLGALQTLGIVDGARPLAQERLNIMDMTYGGQFPYNEAYLGGFPKGQWINVAWLQCQTSRIDLNVNNPTDIVGYSIWGAITNIPKHGGTYLPRLLWQAPHVLGVDHFPCDATMATNGDRWNGIINGYCDNNPDGGFVPLGPPRIRPSDTAPLRPFQLEWYLSAGQAATFMDLYRARPIRGMRIRAWVNCASNVAGPAWLTLKAEHRRYRINGSTAQINVGQSRSVTQNFYANDYDLQPVDLYLDEDTIKTFRDASGATDFAKNEVDGIVIQINASPPTFQLNNGYWIYVQGLVILTQLEVFVDYDDALSGYGSDVNFSIGSAPGQSAYRDSSRAVKKINIQSLIDLYGWDIFSSGTTVTLTGNGHAGINPSWVRLYRVYFEAEHRPYVEKSGFGSVIADVEGLQTAAGKLIENPADVAATLISNVDITATAVQDADFGGIDSGYLDFTSFTSVFQSLAAIGAGYKLARRIVDDVEIRDLLASLCAESRMRCFFEGSTFRLKFLTSAMSGLTASAPTLSTANTDRLTRDYTPTADIVNRLIARYRFDPSTNEPTAAIQRPDPSNEPTASQSENWGLRPETFDLLWHQNSPANIVADLANFMLSRMEVKRYNLNLRAPLELIHLERGDVVPVTNARAGLVSTPAEIIGWRLDSFDRLALALSTDFAGSTVIFSSGSCAIFVTAAGGSYLLLYDGTIIARIDFNGNVDLRGAMIEPSADTATDQTDVFECDAVESALRVNAEGSGTYRSVALFRSNGDLEASAKNAAGSPSVYVENASTQLDALGTPSENEPYEIAVSDDGITALALRGQYVIAFHARFVSGSYYNYIYTRGGFRENAL